MARESKPPMTPLAAGQKPTIELTLVALSGDDLKPGTEVELPHHEPLPVGRAAKGLQLTDALVSIQHARIYYDQRRGCVVEDLGSATGTWVDEECVRKDSRPIGVGTRLKFGETQFEVRQVRLAPRWLGWVAAGLAAVAIAMASMWSLQQLQTPPPPQLQCPASHLGPLSIRSLLVPEDFLRRRGIIAADLRCDKVTDDDEDGRPEVWLERTDGKRDYVVRPEEDGTWTVLGELPAGCSTLSRRPAELPMLDCLGETWLVDEGRYRVIDPKGIVVWYRPTKPPEPAPTTPPAPGEPATMPGLAPTELGPVKVGRFPLKGDGLGAFLATRGVDRPIHYLICEEAFEGIHFQALNDEEQVVELQVGCISDLKLEGAIAGKPVALALSPAGRQALIDDVTTFYAGNPDGLFLPEEWRPLVDSLAVAPGYEVASTKLVADTKESAAPSFSPRPVPSRAVESAHALIPQDSRHAPAPLALTVPVLRSGKAQADPPGCTVLRTTTGPFRASAFGFSKTFLVIDEVGCGEPRTVATVGYTGGVQDVKLDGLELRVVVDARTSNRGFEVASARLSWREP